AIRESPRVIEQARGLIRRRRARAATAIATDRPRLATPQRVLRVLALELRAGRRERANLGDALAQVCRDRVCDTATERLGVERERERLGVERDAPAVAALAARGRASPPLQRAGAEVVEDDRCLGGSHYEKN